jgi:membrane protein DedA with SNARE-associated domain
MSHAIVQLITAGGLIAVFLTMAAESAGIPISSEIVVPLGGALASEGKLSFVGVVLAASAGNLLGSLIAYLLVRRYGERLILGPGRRLGLTAGHLRLANRFFARFGLFAVFVGRLLPVIRTYISFPAGLSRITLLPFTLATVAGAIPWNLALAYAGYQLGKQYERVAGTLGRFTLPLAIALLVLIVVGYYYGRRLGKQEPV